MSVYIISNMLLKKNQCRYYIEYAIGNKLFLMTFIIYTIYMKLNNGKQSLLIAKRFIITILNAYISKIKEMCYDCQ